MKGQENEKESYENENSTQNTFNKPIVFATRFIAHSARALCFGAFADSASAAIAATGRRLPQRQHR
jgi:hypothetical protein